MDKHSAFHYHVMQMLKLAIWLLVMWLVLDVWSRSASALDVSFYAAPRAPLSVSFYETKPTPVELPERKIQSPLEQRPAVVHEKYRRQPRGGWRLRRLFGGRRR